MMARHGIVLAVMLPSLRAPCLQRLPVEVTVPTILHGIQSTSPVCRKKSEKRSSSYAEIRLPRTTSRLIFQVDKSSALWRCQPGTEYGSSGLVNGDTLSGGLATAATATSNVGGYGIAQGSLAASSNYALSYAGANLTVTAAPLTVTADAQSRPYGAANPALTYVSSGLVNGDAPSGTLFTSATATSNVGAYAIAQGTLAASANYTLTYLGADLTVTSASASAPAPVPVPPPMMTSPPDIIAMDAPSAAFPSFFVSSDLRPNEADDSEFASNAASSACGSLQVLRSLNQYGLANLSGSTASCVRNFSQTK